LFKKKRSLSIFDSERHGGVHGHLSGDQSKASIYTPAATRFGEDGQRTYRIPDKMSRRRIEREAFNLSSRGTSFTRNMMLMDSHKEALVRVWEIGKTGFSE